MFQVGFWCCKRQIWSTHRVDWDEDNLKNEDDLKIKDDLKYGDNLKYEDDLKYEDNLKYEGNLKYEDNLKYKDNLSCTKTNQIYRVFKSKWYKFWVLLTMKWVYPFMTKGFL